MDLGTTERDGQCSPTRSQIANRELPTLSPASRQRAGFVASLFDPVPRGTLRRAQGLLLTADDAEQPERRPTVVPLVGWPSGVRSQKAGRGRVPRWRSGELGPGEREDVELLETVTDRLEHESAVDDLAGLLVDDRPRNLLQRGWVRRSPSSAPHVEDLHPVEERRTLRAHDRHLHLTGHEGAPALGFRPQ